MNVSRAIRKAARRDTLRASIDAWCVVLNHRVYLCNFPVRRFDPADDSANAESKILVAVPFFARVLRQALWRFEVIGGHDYWYSFKFQVRVVGQVYGGHTRKSFRGMTVMLVIEHFQADEYRLDLGFQKIRSMGHQVAEAEELADSDDLAATAELREALASWRSFDLDLERHIQAVQRDS